MNGLTEYFCFVLAFPLLVLSLCFCISYKIQALYNIAIHTLYTCRLTEIHNGTSYNPAGLVVLFIKHFYPVISVRYTEMIHSMKENRK